MIITLDIQAAARELIMRSAACAERDFTPTIQRYARENGLRVQNLLAEMDRQASQPRSPLSSAG